MKNIDVYMVHSDSRGGAVRTQGFIYSVEEHIANQLISEGKASRVEFNELKRYEDSVAVLTDDLTIAVEKVLQNNRLTIDARKSDILSLVNEAKIKADKVQSDYIATLKRLKQDAEKRAISYEEEEKVDWNKIKQDAGIIRTQIVMQPNLISVISIINDKLPLLEKPVIRTLLSQFYDIRAELEKVGSNLKPEIKRQSINEIYRKILEFSKDEQQVGSDLDYQKLEAKEKYQGNITNQFNKVAERLLRKTS
ncbi:hypothetical protein MHI57_10725 [Cytobacillus sp. FSL K6-0129]|uniref:hypothetical protein n=1 Tax=Cytobacillus sp. FSL K6-0129 TaxID=2921421 RepID=UPI0030FC1764